MEFTMEDPGKAFAVLHELSALIKAYGSASVADFKTIIGEDVQYIDRTLGWVSSGGLLKSSDFINNKTRIELADPVSLVANDNSITIRREMKDTLDALNDILGEIKKSAAELGVSYTTMTDKRGKLMAKDILVAKAMLLSTLGEMSVKNV